MKNLIKTLLKSKKSIEISENVQSRSCSEYKTIPLVYTEDCKPLGFKQKGAKLSFNEIAEKQLVINSVFRYD